MQSTNRQLRKRIDRLERLPNSNNGNPKYRVHFTDGTLAETATDSSIGLTITNSEYQADDVLVTINYRGKIIDIQPAPLLAEDKVAEDKVALAKQLLEAHDALLATYNNEPSSSEEGMPYDVSAWQAWERNLYTPAYTAFRTALDKFRTAVPHHGMGNGRHPLTFRHECKAIIAAAIRDAAPQQ